MGSLVKYYGQQQGNGRGNLHWGRADRDGLPFRGREIPHFKEEEAEEHLAIVGDAKAELFDVTQEGESRTRYLQVVDCIVNGWFVCLHREHNFHEGKMLVYLEWVERFMEDKKPNAHDAVHSHIQPPQHEAHVAARRSITQVGD
jgi:hypothetical protein